MIHIKFFLIGLCVIILLIAISVLGVFLYSISEHLVLIIIGSILTYCIGGGIWFSLQGKK